MRNLKDIVRRGREGPSLMFRARLYDLENPDDFLADISALANADIVGQRALIIGVTPGEPGKRRVQPLPREEVPDASTIWALVEKYIEPSLKVQVLTPGNKSTTLLVILLEDCQQPPYLLKRPCGVILKGAGFIRRGDQNFPLGREESVRLSNREALPVARAAPSDPDVSAGPGKPLSLAFPDGEKTLKLAARADIDLPSSMAARRLEAAIKARREVQEMKGLDTGIVRLMHVRAFGQDEPFAKRSIEELEDELRAVQRTFAAEDEFHLFEKTGLRLNFKLRNLSDKDLEGVVLRMRIQRIDGFEVAPCVYTIEIDKSSQRRALKDSENAGYPHVHRQEQFLDVSRKIGDLQGGAECPAFPEPLRIGVKRPAFDKKIHISYELGSPGLESPVKGTLSLRLVAEQGDG